MCVYILRYTVHVCMCYKLLELCVHTRVLGAACAYGVFHMECACIVCSDACVHLCCLCVCTHVSLCGECAYGLFVGGVWGVHGCTYMLSCVYTCVVYVCMICSHTVWGCVCEGCLTILAGVSDRICQWSSLSSTFKAYGRESVEIGDKFL